MKLSVKLALVVIAILQLSACSSLRTTEQCPPGTQQLEHCPPMNAINDVDINKIYNNRTWMAESKQQASTIDLAVNADIPTNLAVAKIVGPSYEESLRSLATKIWLIENAQHSVDLIYYIFAKDEVGYAVLGALCDAVKRGVDVRIMVDSLGSIRPMHNELKALQTCEQDAGFIRNAAGQITTKRARVQTGIFNAISNLHFNRRSHDKMLVVDGSFADRAVVMTGGRNIALDYYGITRDGSADPTAFRDLEVIIKPAPNAVKPTVGEVAETYYSLLFSYKGNNIFHYANSTANFDHELKRAREGLEFIKSQPDIKQQLDSMAQFMGQGLVNSEVRLAHQLGNITRERVVASHIEYIKRSANTIGHIIGKAVSDASAAGPLKGTLKVISPYLFISKYPDKKGETAFDAAKIIHQILDENPDLKIEMITNSVLTSDNGLTQSFIDIAMIPSMYLKPETLELWKSFDEKDLPPEELLSKEDWQAMLKHERLAVYQTGGLDAVILGGNTYYGKLHAKFIFTEQHGFIGTSNFDYRSNLYNNEAGFFFTSPELSTQLDTSYEMLKRFSYRWGSPEWFEMRRKLMGADSIKAFYIGHQRGVYRILKALGFEYLL